MSSLPPSSYTAALAKATAEAINEKLAPLIRRLEALEQGGARTLIDSYAGIFRDGVSYQRGQLVTDRGGLWFCNADTDTRPGTGPHWTLAVKAGKDRA